MFIKEIFLASKIVAPRTIGIANKNENFIASSFFKPENKPAEIVEPLLEIPGRSAKICVKPITNELYKETCFSLTFFLFLFLGKSFLSFMNFVEKIRIPFIIKKIPTKRILENIELIKLLKKYQAIAAGIAAIITKSMYLMFFFSVKFRSSRMSFLKTKMTASIEAKCKNTSKERFSKLKKY